MDKIEDIINEVTFKCENVEQAPYTEMRKALEAHQFIRISGLFNPSEISKVRQTIDGQFDQRNDRKHNPNDIEAIRGNLQKIKVGGGGADNCARFLRMLYNPVFCPDIYGMREMFVRLARFRNLLFGLPLDFAIYGTEENFWTASRINQYPTGGGFMSPHRDAEVYDKRPHEADPKTDYQCLLLMTEKGKDFHNGGAFVDYQEQRIEYEDYCHVGDVVVYDGRVTHGVNDIDPLAPLELNSFSGRIAAFVTLFRELG